MIWEWMAGAMSGLLVGIAGALPRMDGVTLPAQPAGLLPYFGTLDSGLPLHEALQLLGVFLGLQAARLVWDLIIWVYHQIPIFGGHS